MPFKSEAQRRWMYANKPRMAARWQKETGKGADLPEKVEKTSEFNAYLNAALVKAAERRKVSMQQPMMPMMPDMEGEENRKQELHNQQLQFADDKHQLELEKMKLDLQHQQQQFELTQQHQNDQEQFKMDTAMAKQEQQAAGQQEQQMQQMQEQQMMQAQQQQAAQQQQDQYRANLMGKAAAQYMDQYGYPQDSGSPALPIAAGAGMGGAAAHYIVPTKETTQLRTLAESTGLGDAMRRAYKNKAIQANAKRLLAGAGLGALAGYGLHEYMKPN